jgi:glycosyltransferase involved in cell wall biosynthesis
MAQQALLTVAIPTYNRAGMLADALECLLDQNLNPGEFVVAVSDNASTDHTRAVVERYSARLNFNYHRHQENRGIIPNWVYAGSMCDTLFLSYLCDDDILAPGQLGRAVDALKGNPSAVLFTTVNLAQRYPGDPFTKSFGFMPAADASTSYFKPYTFSREEWMASLMPMSTMYLCGSVMTAAAFRRCGRWTNYPQTGDRILFAELGLQGDVLTLPWVGAHRRNGPQQRTYATGEEVKVLADILEMSRTHQLDPVGYWARTVARADRETKQFYVDYLAHLLPSDVFTGIVTRAERLQGSAIQRGRLDRLGLPPVLVRLARRLWH